MTSPVFRPASIANTRDLAQISCRPLFTPSAIVLRNPIRMCGYPFFVPLLRAQFAVSPSVFTNAGGLWQKGVAFVAHSFALVNSSRTCASCVIHGACNRFKVSMINASAIAAEVIQLKPGWNWANRKLISVSMRNNTLVVCYAKNAISIPLRCLPRPAVTRASCAVNFQPKAFLDSKMVMHSDPPIPGATPRAVTAAPRLSRTSILLPLEHLKHRRARRRERRFWRNEVRV